MRSLFPLINLGLAVLVAGGTMALREHRPETRWEEVAPFDIQPTTETPANAAAQVPPFRAVALGEEEKSILWEKTLFHPRRTDEVPTVEGPPDDDAPTTPQRNLDMELIGIGKMGDRQAAIILVKASRRRTDQPSGTRNVYRLGDDIQDTGYTLVNIQTSDVELKRGDESRILALNSGDTPSERRAQAAAQDAAQRTRSQRAKSSPPPPPPPPPVPGGAGADKNESPEEAERREKIRRAIEARKALLEARRKAREDK
mgnify:CR=1 FL=1